jgi:hypothetical protein
MNELPFRTNATWLSDDELVLLDVLFNAGTWVDLLTQESFHEQWNLGYSHQLNDNDLRTSVEKLCHSGVVRVDVGESDRLSGPCIQLTPHGGDLWSLERCPIWERYCMERYSETSAGRTIMTVIAASPEVRDDYLRVWPRYPARRREFTLYDYQLISWRQFPRLYVGAATYHEQRSWSTFEEYSAYRTMFEEHQQLVKRERSWWRGVRELQRFLSQRA